jgi:hypothetical protein
MPLTCHHNRGIRRFWLPCLMVGVALVSARCAHSGHTGELEVNSLFTGRVPGGGHLKLGAVNSQGHAVVAGMIGPRARKTLTLPAGNYTVAVWLPDAAKLTSYRDLCSARATVTAGRTSTVTMSCLWH